MLRIVVTFSFIQTPRSMWSGLMWVYIVNWMSHTCSAVQMNENI